MADDDSKKDKHKDKTDKQKKKDKSHKKDKGKDKVATEATSTRPVKSETATVLIVDSDDKNWYKVFEGVVLKDGRKVVVEKTRWEHMIISSDSTKCIVNLRPNAKPLPGTKEDSFRTVVPDFVLVRKLIRGLTKDEDYSNALFGLMYTNLPAVNSLHSCFMCLERPLVHAELHKIKQRLGADEFPLISQQYYSQQNSMIFTPEPPLVVKVGYAQAGYGKMKFDTSENLADFRGVLALHKDYVTAEPFIKGRDYDLRIQKIGSHYRVYKRQSSNWKGNVGNSIIEEIPITDKYRKWADEAGKMFGGIDILTVDAIHTADGKEYILEMNDSASGLYGPNEAEDMGYIRDLVVERLEELSK